MKSGLCGMGLEVWLFLFQFVDEFINILPSNSGVVFFEESIETDNDE
ncbi:hypothetical protein [Bacteroides ovatus]|nr:hypothetical protein [Bacteroides ovatus]